MEALVARTRESTSIAQLDGSDIVYVARVAVPKIVTLAVTIGTRFPRCRPRSARCCWPGCCRMEAERVLAELSRSGIAPRWQPDAAERAAALREVRARGWALTDEQLAPASGRSPSRCAMGEGTVIAALNVNSHAAETPLDDAGRPAPAAADPGGRGDQRRLGGVLQGTPQVTIAVGNADPDRRARMRGTSKASESARPGPLSGPADRRGLFPRPGRAVLHDAARRPRR